MKKYERTPAWLCRTLVELAAISPSSDVLEPSAGDGDVVAAILEKTTHVTAVEVQADLVVALRARCPQIQAHHADFLSWYGGLYDRIIINPPFEDDAAHLQHALKMLQPGGRLVGVVTDECRKAAGIANWLPLPEVIFGVAPPSVIIWSGIG